MWAIAEKYGVAESIVWKRIKEFGLVRKDGRIKKYNQRSLSHRLNLSKAHEGRNAGDKNPNWRGGFYEDNLRERRGGPYQRWRAEALERAGNCCQQCGAKKGTVCECCGMKISLHVHHIESFARCPEKRFDPANSEVLCQKCHHSRHYGKLGEFGETPNVKSRAIPSEAAEGHSVQRNV
jgi:hypothetical protein